MYTDLDTFLQELPVHAQKHAAELKGHDMLVLLETDTGRRLYLRLADGLVTASSTDDGKPDCSVYAAEATLLDLLNGRLHPVKAIMFGKLKIKGDAGRLLALARLV